MNLEELAYVNQQLAAMLRDGLPLSGALKELAGGLRAGGLGAELKALELDIAAGRSLEEAVTRRTLPPLYARLLVAGSRSGDLAGALTMAADYYGEVYQRRLRLRTLMVYPCLVILVGLALTFIIGWFQNSMFQSVNATTAGGLGHASLARLTIWVIPGSFALMAAIGATLLLLPGLRRWLGWRVPGFRESRVANLSGSIGLMLRQNCPLPEAVALVRELEDDARVRFEMAGWLDRIARGEPPLRTVEGATVLPSLLPWLVGGRPSDLGEGFLRAAGFYHRRATHRLDLLVNGALPISLVLLGAGAAGQAFFIIQFLVRSLDSLGGFE